jgi:hypothetical protein
MFAPANHYKGKYFDNMKVKESKLLKDEDIAELQANADKIQREDQKAALGRLIEGRKVASIDDDATLRGLANSKVMGKKSGKILKHAHKAVRHTAKKVKAFRKWITWLFAFGLVGLGMQITLASMKQAGGAPAIIGGVVGLTKAVASLVVVMMLISETI